jgi:hypothetical protein
MTLSRYIYNMRTFIFFFLSCLSASCVLAQPEMEPWGNMTGIRIDGQLMDFESSIRLSMNDKMLATAKEKQNPHYARSGNAQVVSTHLDSLYFVETVEDAGAGIARIKLSWTAHAAIKIEGAFFSLDLPEHRHLEVHPDQPVTITRIATEGHHTRLDIPLQSGELQNGQSGICTLTITATGGVDREPIHLTLNTANPGRPFDGLGGNFRIQNLKTDPQVINYCLENLRLAWGRVELPWRFWQPEQRSSPLDSARAGRINPAVQRAMDMAHTLGARGIPLILSAWFPPNWAAVGPMRFRPGPDHVWGNPLNHDSTAAIYKSIADYIVFLKEHYEVEPRYFSFNESDLGINVRQTAEEHDELVKGLGQYFVSRGLKTRVLLGDNSDATTWAFIDPAMNDTTARPYISMISFHSWRGFDTATLQHWADAATRLHVPVVVGEGSIDAAAWAYPAIFQEPTYALKEISLYTRLLAVCQPLSILQWQLTADYSLMAGGGIFGDTSILRPTQRFWNLKQLAMTPRGLFAMPIASDRPNIAVAALGDNAKHMYAVHMVNNGATRLVVLTGLPAKVRRLRSYTTTQTEGIKEGPPVAVKNGQAAFTLEAQSYLTLIGR